MKKTVVWILAAMLLLTACSGGELETVGDVYPELEAPAWREVMLELPEEAYVPAWAAGSGETVYQCQGYELTVQQFAGMEPEEALVQLTGQPAEHLTVMCTRAGEELRYDCTWITTGETGERVGRTALLTDGEACYAVTCLADSGDAHGLQKQWTWILDSFALGQYWDSAS